MPRKAITPDQRVLRGGALGITLHIGGSGGALHADMKVHQIAVEKVGRNAAINRDARARDLGLRLCGAGGQKRQSKGGAAQAGYSAASGNCARSASRRLRSAIRTLARAIGLVR